MSFFKYHFNPGTRVQTRSRIRAAIVYSFKLLFTSAILCAGMIIAHDLLKKTDKTALLKEENARLDTFKPGLEDQIAEVEENLALLHQMDSTLYSRLFSASPTSADNDESKLTRDRVLLAGVSDFQSIIDVLRERSSQLVEKSAASNHAFGEKIKISKEQIEALQNIPTIQPIFNAQLDQLVSGFGERINPFHKGKYNHPGVDFASSRGSAVFATAPGKIIRIKKTSLQAGYGNYVEIDHGNGYVTRYAHLDAISVHKGQKVFKGKIIGTAGSSGGSIAPHLHYEVIKDGEQVNPVHYLLEGLTSEQYGALLQNAAKQNQSLD